MCKTHTSSAIKILESTHHNDGRIWSVPAVHGDLGRLVQLHDHIYEHFKLGDQLVYHGNYIGYGERSAECIDEILTFRRMILSIRGVIPRDITFLRGTQEELWKRMLQLSFDPKPADTLLWMLGHGVGASLKSYGFCPHDALEACQYGTIGLTRWTSRIRETVRNRPGHEIFFTKLKRAAHSTFESGTPLLFVHAGLNSSKPLEEQGDAFWWGSSEFESMEAAYGPFHKVVRGFDPLHKGADFNGIKATTDNGCGFGGSLISAAFMADGSIFDIIEA